MEGAVAANCQGLKPFEEKTLNDLKSMIENAASLYELSGTQETEADTEIRRKLGDASLWGVPILPSQADPRTDGILLKFLRARELKVNDAFEMLRKTIMWRQKIKIDEILQKDFGSDLDHVAFIVGEDREGHPVCYNNYWVFANKEQYDRIFGPEEKCEEFLRWKLQFMEKSIERLSFKYGEPDSFVHVTDLNNSKGLCRKEIRTAIKKAINLFQDNYPEFVGRYIFINVPFWYHLVVVMLSPFLTQRTKSKFIFARPTAVAETLLRFIAPENVPVRYGGLKRENDEEFTGEDGSISELIVLANSVGSVEIPLAKAGVTVVWDITVVDWEVNYKEEFAPDDECSYIIVIHKEKKMPLHQEARRYSFHISEPGKLILTIQNSSFKKKRALFRYKTKPTIFPVSSEKSTQEVAPTALV